MSEKELKKLGKYFNKNYGGMRKREYVYVRNVSLIGNFFYEITFPHRIINKEIKRLNRYLFIKLYKYIKSKI